MMQAWEDEEMVEWIEENIGEDAGEVDSPEWDKAVQAYYDYHERQQIMEMEDYYQSEYEFYLNEKSPSGTFKRQIRNIKDLLKVETTSDAHFSLLVMLHAHTVASLEAYLASTFMQKVLNSDVLIRKLVESEPIFSKEQFTLKEIYIQHERINSKVADHLKKLIFHRIRKVKPMFKTVLNIDFGDIGWLVKAVDMRHHCVHRAGIDYDGNRVDITVESVLMLVSSSSLLVENIDYSITSMNSDGDILF